MTKEENTLGPKEEVASLQQQNLALRELFNLENQAYRWQQLLVLLDTIRIAVEKQTLALEKLSSQEEIPLDDDKKK